MTLKGWGWWGKGRGKKRRSGLWWLTIGFGERQAAEVQQFDVAETRDEIRETQCV